METELAFETPLPIPAVVLLLLYWAAVILTFRLVARRAAAAAVREAIGDLRGTFLIGIRVPLGRWIAAMLLPPALVALAAILS